MNYLIVKASELGCVLDCNLDTGKTFAGGAATDNTAIINAFLAQGTAQTPVVLVMDGATICTGIFLPVGGDASIIGQGWNTGFYVKSGSNQDCIHNGPANAMLPWAPGPPAPAQATGYVVLSNFRINGNRGNGTTGNSNNGNPRGIDGTVWYCGINLLNLSGIEITKLWVYDAATYAIRMGNCSQVVIKDCRFEAPSMQINCDGTHFDGPMSDIFISSCYFKTGDDAIALNAPEGYTGNIANVQVVNCDFDGSYSMMRFYANVTGTAVTGVVVANCRATTTTVGLVFGADGAAGPADSIKDVSITNVHITSPQPVRITQNVGILKFSNCSWVSPTTAAGWLNCAATGAINVSVLELNQFSIYRNAAGNAAGYLLQGGLCTIGTLVLNGVDIPSQAGQSYGAVAALCNFTGTVNRVIINALDSKNITAFSASLTPFQEVSGPGVYATGYEWPDGIMRGNTLYISATTHTATLPSLNVNGLQIALDPTGTFPGIGTDTTNHQELSICSKSPGTLWLQVQGGNGHTFIGDSVGGHTFHFDGPNKIFTCSSLQLGTMAGNSATTPAVIGFGNDLFINSNPSGAIFFNWDRGNGGIKFCDGAEHVIARIDVNGNLILKGTVTPNGTP